MVSVAGSEANDNIEPAPWNTSLKYSKIPGNIYIMDSNNPFFRILKDQFYFDLGLVSFQRIFLHARYIIRWRESVNNTSP